MSKITNRNEHITNLKPDSWYKEFYGDWILEFYKGIHSLEECIEFQKDYDKGINNNQFEPPKIYEYDCKEFIIKNNSFEKNRELLIKYERQQLSYEVEGEKRDLKIQKLFNKCFDTLEQGYMITNQLFIFNIWFEEEFEIEDEFEIEVDDEDYLEYEEDYYF